MNKSKRLPFILITLVLAAALMLGAAYGCTKAPAGPEGTEGPAETDEPVTTDEPENKAKVLAHWKLQNETGCSTGSVDDDSIGFVDLSGNGNDLIAKTVGNGDQLDIFSWDTDVDSNVKFGSGLKMNNTSELAKTVDPYKASQTSYTGGYTSGKYLETVKGAPINSYTFPNGFSIEVIFKLSEDLDIEYNRYTGIFSRQGVVKDMNEPPFSIAITEWAADESSALLGSNETWLQLLLVDESEKTNSEMDRILICAGEWYHVLITLDDLGKVSVYLNGEELHTEYTVFEGIFCTDPNYSWEVGVGRKDGEGHTSDSKNENSPEGMIRRLFAGSVAEIRVLDQPIGVADSLYATEFVKK